MHFLNDTYIQDYRRQHCDKTHKWDLLCKDTDTEGVTIISHIEVWWRKGLHFRILNVLCLNFILSVQHKQSGDVQTTDQLAIYVPDTDKYNTSENVLKDGNLLYDERFQ